MRKRTLEYDDVMNKQREVLYGFRNEIIHGDDVRDRLLDVMEEVVLTKVVEFTNADDPHEWNVRGLADWVNLNFPIGMPEEEIVKAAQAGKEEPESDSVFGGLTAMQFGVCNFISGAIRETYRLKIASEKNEDALKSVERLTILEAIDKLWREHLYEMDSLRTSIGLRAHGQRDPLLEYKAEAFKLFDDLMVNIKTEICHNIFRSASSLMAFEQFLRQLPQRTEHGSASAFGGTTTTSSGAPAETKASDVVSEANEQISKAKPIRSGPKVGRNDPCPCNSGKKFKQCHGKFG
jgi:preprotein translocase subunit SecA